MVFTPETDLRIVQSGYVGRGIQEGYAKGGDQGRSCRRSADGRHWCRDQAAAAVKQPDAAGLDTKIRRDVLAKNILDNERLKEELQQARQQIGAMTPKKDE